MNWKENKIHLGEVKEGSIKKFTFANINPDLEIEKVVPSCGGCTKATFVGKEIFVQFKADKIPIHLASEGDFQNVAKHIKVYYSNGTEETIEFRAKIIKR